MIYSYTFRCLQKIHGQLVGYSVPITVILLYIALTVRCSAVLNVTIKGLEMVLIIRFDRDLTTIRIRSRIVVVTTIIATGITYYRLTAYGLHSISCRTQLILLSDQYIIL